MASTAWETIASGSPGPAGLRAQGIVFPVYIAGPHGILSDELGMPLAVQCMWDTGSDQSSVSATLLQDLGAPEVGSVTISTVQGTETVPCDLATIAISPTDFPLSAGALPVLADSLPSGVRVLIGRDIQSMYRLTCDGVHGTWRIEAPAPTPQPPTPARAWLAPAAVVGAGVLAVVLAEVLDRG